MKILKIFTKINDPVVFYVIYFGKYFQNSHKFILNINSKNISYNCSNTNPKSP